MTPATRLEGEPAIIYCDGCKCTRLHSFKEMRNRISHYPGGVSYVASIDEIWHCDTCQKERVWGTRTP